MLNWCQDLVDGLRQDRNHGVIIPSTDWQLKLLGAESSTKTLDTDKIIRRHEYRIASSMLSDLILIGGDAAGSFALAETKQSMLLSSLQAIIGSIAATLNSQAVPALFAVNNWQLEKLPQITADDLEQPSASDIALILRSLKVDVSKSPKLFNFLLKIMQAPQLTDEEYTEFMAAASASADDEPGSNPDDLQDPIENDLKQSDQLTR